MLIPMGPTLAEVPIGALTEREMMETHILGATLSEEAPYPLLLAICTVESNLNPKAINPADGDDKQHSVGLCQIKLQTAKWMRCKGIKKESDLFDPRKNARCAARFVGYQLDRYNHTWDYAIAAYNSGTLKRTKRGRIVNQGYVNKVLKELYK